MEFVLAVGVGFVNYYLPEPYMDEEFHTNQTNSYFYFELDQWDEKLTTFPGTFFITAMLRHLVYIPGAVDPILAYRAFNSFFSMALYWLLRKSTDTATAVYLMCLPPLFSSCFVYYTDVPALLSAVWVWWLVKKEKYFFSGVFGALAVAVRQTNIIWVGYAVLSSLTKKDDDFLTWGKRNLAQVSTTLKHFYIHILLLLGFVYFVYCNEGIVLGDKGHHLPVFHLAQLLYLHLALLVYLPITIRSSLNYYALFLSLCVSWAAVNWFTHVHPFLLSDNRHYTFYLWKEFLAPFSLLLVPVYSIAGEYVYSYKSSSLHYGIWLFCASITLIPAGLLEPRYFIPAIIFFFLENDIRVGKLRAIGALVINLALLWIFVKAPYKNIHFMW